MQEWDLGGIADLSLMTNTDGDLHFPAITSLHQKENNHFFLNTKPVSNLHFIWKDLQPAQIPAQVQWPKNICFLKIS